MFIRALQLRDFRNCQQAHLEFSPCVNIISGANAQGKTSLLEAIFLCIAGRSFRTSQIHDLVRYEQPHFYVETRFIKNSVEQRIRVTYGAGERRILYNSTLCQSASALLGVIPGVAMTSEDIALVRGMPQTRRHFLDLQIAQTDPLYLHHLTRYQRAMRQRNQLLRQHSTVSIESWESEMANSAAYIAKSRAITVQELLQYGQQRYNRLSANRERLGLSYKSQAPVHSDSEEIRQYYLRQYHELRRREMQLGVTLTGPHRDDFSLAIDEKESRAFSSEGQQRCVVTALRLAERDRIHHVSGIPPLMIIDDVGISLDPVRSEMLFEQLSEMDQVFLSSASELTRYFRPEQVRSFSVNEGSVC